MLKRVPGNIMVDARRVLDLDAERAGTLAPALANVSFPNGTEPLASVVLARQEIEQE